MDFASETPKIIRLIGPLAPFRQYGGAKHHNSRFSPLALPFSKHGGYCKLEGAAGGFHTGSITEFMSVCQIGRSIAVKTTNESPHQDWCEVF